MGFESCNRVVLAKGKSKQRWLPMLTLPGLMDFPLQNAASEGLRNDRRAGLVDCYKSTNRWPTTFYIPTPYSLVSFPR
jgi:hypothetical protein